MRLEYFQMIDRLHAYDAAAATLSIGATVPKSSPIFEGHFPGYPIMPGVLLLETMAQTSGFLLLLLNRMAQMPFFAGVKKGKFRQFVLPGAEMDSRAKIVHQGSGYAVTSAEILVAGKSVCEAEITFGLVPFPAPELEAYLRGQMERLGLTEAEISGVPG